MPSSPRRSIYWILCASVSASAPVVLPSEKINVPNLNPPFIFIGEATVSVSTTDPLDIIAGVLCGVAPACGITAVVSVTATPAGKPIIS